MTFRETRYCLLPIALSCTVSCGTEVSVDGVMPKAQPIVGGVVAGTQNHPSAVAILADYQPLNNARITDFWCSGVLVAPDVVLTAAHCIEVLPVDASVWATRHNNVTDFDDVAKLPSDAVLATGGLIHPDYDPQKWTTVVSGLNQFNDLALIWLETRLASDVATPLGPEIAPEIGTDVAITIVGYGSDDAMVTQGLGQKRVASSVIDEFNGAEFQVGGVYPLPQACTGDSGGPGYVEALDDELPSTRLAGITSRSFSSSTCTSGSIQTRLDPYWGWLDTSMREACGTAMRPACVQEGLLTPAPPQQKGGGGCQSVTFSRWWLSMLLVVSAARRKR